MEIGEIETRAAHESGADITIRYPDTLKPSDLVITVQGVDSSSWREASKKSQRELISIISRGESIESTDSFELDALVSCTLGWKGLTKDGKAYKFSAKRCRALYENAPNIRDQVDKFIGTRANFTQG